MNMHVRAQKERSVYGPMYILQSLPAAWLLGKPRLPQSLLQRLPKFQLTKIHLSKNLTCFSDTPFWHTVTTLCSVLIKQETTYSVFTECHLR